jgi:hypothetical protein
MSEAMQILEQVNSFYSGAFTQLITFTVSLLAVVGVLMPLGIAAYQNRQLKHDQKTLNDRIDNELSAARLALSEQLAKDLVTRDEVLKSLIEKTKSEIAQEVKKIDELATARSLHLQALANRESTPAFATYDSLMAVSSYARNGDEMNLNSALTIFTDCIKKVTEDDFKNFDIEEESQSVTKALDDLNANGRYTADIREIRRGIQDAKTRKTDKK